MFSISESFFFIQSDWKKKAWEISTQVSKGVVEGAQKYLPYMNAMDQKFWLPTYFCRLKIIIEFSSADDIKKIIYETAILLSNIEMTRKKSNLLWGSIYFHFPSISWRNDKISFSVLWRLFLKINCLYKDGMFDL